MANSNRNLLTQTYSGKVGNQLVLKTRGEKSIMAAKPKRRKVLPARLQSQAAVKRRFRIAVIYATKAMANPAMKEAYQAVIRGNQTAYNVAFADAFKGPELSDLNIESYNGAAGQPIIVTAIDNFRVASVKFTLLSADGTKLEEGDAVQDENGFDWVYTTQVANPSLPGTKLRVTAMDVPKNKATLEVVL